MKMLLCEVLLILLVVSFSKALQYRGAYDIPVPKIQAFTPSGFRISVEHSPGIEFVVFHVNINKEFDAQEPGDYSKEIFYPIYGRWTFSEPNINLSIGDQVNCWFFMKKNRLGYIRHNILFTITELERSPFATSHTHQTRPPHTHRESHPRSCDQCNSEEEPQKSTTPSPESTTSSLLHTCEQVLLNSTNTLVSVITELNQLRKEYQQLTKLVEKGLDSKKLTLSGRIPPDDEPRVIASFVINEKLDLSPDIVSAVRNSDNSITFEVATLAEKLQILEAAKENLKYSKIVIA